MEKELTGRNKWGFASNCIPRDLTYVLVSLFFLTFIQYTCGFTNQQFIVLSSIIVLCRVWDAVNDPMMSTIITNTKSRFGRYRPWILIGAISNSVFLVLMFLSPGLTGWGYVAYLGIAYLLYGMTFTMNDVSYWSLLPHLARSKDSRDKLTGLVAIFASVGSFISGGLIPILTTGNMIIAYRIYAIVAALLFIVSQLLVFLLVKDKNDPNCQPLKETTNSQYLLMNNNGQNTCLSSKEYTNQLLLDDSYCYKDSCPNFYYKQEGDTKQCSFCNALFIYNEEDNSKHKIISLFERR